MTGAESAPSKGFAFSSKAGPWSRAGGVRDFTHLGNRLCGMEGRGKGPLIWVRILWEMCQCCLRERDGHSRLQKGLRTLFLCVLNTRGLMHEICARGSTPQPPLQQQLHLEGLPEGHPAN
ncbi:hypothetical protein D623_10026296 [Myotis brandtii]|uniref:Uncharacterized protein n=1 Tax=Myotis brandtii TaxID=109478 RepID=S7P347_MYOBR|nr:hypothetical protein D623_10026296 [Myotis brandtii]